MLRPAILVVLAFFLQDGIQAQQVESHGVPASVLSPTSPGTAHRTPSSVTSPSVPTGANGRTFINSRGPRVRFGPRLRRRHHEVLPVPIFIPAYPLVGDQAYVQPDDATNAPAEDDQSAAASGSADSEALREAYMRGAHDALVQQGDDRYGEHYLDGREKAQSKPQAGSKSSGKENTADDTAETENVVDDSPAAVFIFKDGHKIQTQNYAIQGQTLFDFSNHKLTKIQLGELDLAATKKANDELGIPLKLPSAP